MLVSLAAVLITRLMAPPPITEAQTTRASQFEIVIKPFPCVVETLTDLGTCSHGTSG